MEYINKLSSNDKELLCYECEAIIKSYQENISDVINRLFEPNSNEEYEAIYNELVSKSYLI